MPTQSSAFAARPPRRFTVAAIPEEDGTCPDDSRREPRRAPEGSRHRRTPTGSRRPTLRPRRDRLRRPPHAPQSSLQTGPATPPIGASTSYCRHHRNCKRNCPFSDSSNPHSPVLRWSPAGWSRGSPRVWRSYPGRGGQQAVEGNVNYNCPISRAAGVPGGAERSDLAGLVVTVPRLITAGALPGAFPDANRRLSRDSLCTGQEAIGAHILRSYNACQIRPNYRQDAIGRHGSRPARFRALASKNRCKRRCSYCPNSVGGTACSCREC